MTTSIVAVVALLVLVMAASTVRIAREYERGVVFRLGRSPRPRCEPSSGSPASTSR